MISEMVSLSQARISSPRGHMRTGDVAGHNFPDDEIFVAEDSYHVGLSRTRTCSGLDATRYETRPRDTSQCPDWSVASVHRLHARTWAKGRNDYRIP